MVHCVRWLTESEWLNNFVEVQEFLADLNVFVEGTVVLSVSGLVAAGVWALVTKVASWRGQQSGIRGLLGSVASYIFVIPVQPQYRPPIA